MEVSKYNQMMSYLTRPRERFKNGSKGSNQFTGPGKLRQDIINAYKTLNKGKATTTEDIYNYLTNKKNYKKDRALLKRNIALNLNRENLKFSKDLKKELRSKIQYERRKTAKVDVPTPVYEKGSASTVVEEVLFPEKGPRSKKNFVKDIKKYFSLPKEDSLLTKERSKIIKKYFPNGISKSKFQNLYNFVAEKENIDTERPLKFTDEAEKGRVAYEREKKFQKKFSDVKKEGEFKKAKKGSGLDLAHKLSKETSMRFGLQQTTGTQGIQQPVINQAIAKQYEKRLDVLYDLQQELIKSKPKNLAKQLEVINRMVTSVVEDSGNRIVGVVVDEKNLQPKLYGNLSGARDTIDSGVFNKKIKNLTQKDMDFITKVLIPQSIENQAIIGSDLSGMKNIDKNELIKSLKKSKTVGKPIIKQAENLIKQFPEVTEPTGPLGLDVKKGDILNKYLGALGCPDKFGKFSMGGRIGFQEGTTPTTQCVRAGANIVNEGKFDKLSSGQRANLTQVLNRGAKLGRNILKFGIIPEAIFVAGESLYRMGMGQRLDVSLLKAVDYLLPGNQNKLADKIQLESTLGKDQANIVIKANEYKEAQQKLATATSNLETNQAVLDQSDFGYTGNVDALERQKLDEQIIKDAKQNVKDKFQSEAAMDKATMLAAESEDRVSANSSFLKAIQNARNTEIDDFEQLFTPEKKQEGVAPPLFTMKDLAMGTFSDAELERRQQEMGAPELTKENLFNYYRGNQDFNKLVFKGIFKQGRNSLANREKLFGAQGDFAGGEITGGKNIPTNRFADFKLGMYAGGGIAKLAGKSSGRPPESGPTPQGPQGLDFLIKRGRQS